MIDKPALYIIIAGLALGSFGLRFVFLGLIGNRPMPPWVLRHLRYTAVALIPALVAPMVAWPAVTGGTPDPARLASAMVTLAVGVYFRNVLGAIIAGGVTLYGLLYLVG
ncbi:AzlD domain-containing protein [Aquicoccus sp. G2-2]|uniref:AzlD domain-containing protein n=1 Tax=Aquicoccus sp. G2-2 TaxID=3092120 RepID=UPI002ADF1F02|nr:AzlD domain-containing protein [Aquicoccus sp. G2-2]MEA1113876.1 AzlD domain-containing protein [Aquicoccus sp. G2-2]